MVHDAPLRASLVETVSVAADAPRRLPGEGLAVSNRVLFLNHSGALGGAELCLQDIVRARPAGSRVVLLSDGRLRENLEKAGVPVSVAGGGALHSVRRESAHPSPAAALAILRLAPQVARQARDYDVIYANSQKALLVACLAGLLAGRPVIWHLHDILQAEHFSAGNMRAVVAAANLGVARVIANSNSTAQAFVARGGRADKVRVVYNAIDPAPFDAAAAGPDLGRLELGLPAGRPLVGVFGRLAAWKGQHVVLQALPRLPGVELVLVGDAIFPGEAEYAQSLRDQAQALGVAERVHFLGFRDDIPRLMRAMDIVVHASVAAEPFGRVIAEAMLAGRPVIASRAGGVLEIIEDGVTGRLVTPGCPDDLAAAVRHLCGAPGEAAELGRRGQAHVRTAFAPDRILRQTEDVISEVVRR